MRKRGEGQRLSCSPAATFLGRVCLSDDATGLDPVAWYLVREAAGFCSEVTPIIRDGIFRMGREGDESCQHPTG